MPERPQIYHITHVDNLPAIVADGGLMLGRGHVARGGPAVTIGMTTIKLRRLELRVTCHPARTLATTCRSTSARARSCST